MIGSPIEDGSWNGVEGAYYTAAGSGEFIWLIASGVCCVIALIAGHVHEISSYRAADYRHQHGTNDHAQAGYTTDGQHHPDNHHRDG